MRLRLISSVALLAAAAVGPVNAGPTYNWSGCHLGLEGGGNWGSSQAYYENQTFPQFVGLPETNGIKLSGGLFGGTVGCSFQLSNWVVGIEDDISWTNKSGTANATPPFNTLFTLQTKEDWLDTLRGRLGFAWDSWLFYGTGGGVFSNEGLVVCNPLGRCGNQANSVIGWTAGAGAEYAFWRNWSAKIEYLHVDFGSQSFQSIVGSHNVTLTDDIFRGGVNYKFNLFGPMAPAN